MLLYIVLALLYIEGTLTSEELNGTVTGCDGYPCSPGAMDVEPITSAEEAILLSRCQAKCLDSLATQFGISGIRNQSLWPAVSLTALEKKTCLDIITLDDCKRGCIIRNKNSSSTRTSCRKQCRAECTEAVQTKCGGNFPCSIIPGFPNCGSSECYVTGCKQGCYRPFQASKEPLLPSPLSPINLMKKTHPLPQRPGLFEVGPYEVPQGTTALNLTVFLIQVNTTTKSYYFLKDTITSGTLDLGYLACQATNISFSVVNAIGASSFSPPSSVCIHGGTRYPVLEPDSLNVTIGLDTRPKYHDFAVLYITWRKPIEFHLVTSYELDVEFLDDGNNIHCHSQPFRFTLDNSFTSFVVKSFSSTNQRIPLLNCKYIVSLVVSPKGESNRTEIIVNTDSSKFVPQIIQNCTYSINETTGLADLQTTWTFEDTVDTPIFVNITSKFTVLIQIISWRGDTNALPSSLQDISDDAVAISSNIPAVYTYETGGIQPSTEENIWVRITISPLKRADDIPFGSLLTDSQTQCNFQPRPLPPSAVNSSSISVKKFELTSTSSGIINLTMTWDEPSKPYGIIELYEIRLLHLDLMREVIRRENVSSGDQVVEGNIYISQNAVCLYAQIRARNQYFWSSWSDSVPLLIYPETNPNCMPLAATTPAPPPTVPLVVGGLPKEANIGLGAGIGSIAALLVCIVVLGVIICLLKRHRMKRQMKKVFETGYPASIFLATRDSHDSNSLRLPLTLNYPAPEIDEWEIPVGSVIVESKFGEGCFGEVHRGVVRGPIPTSRSMKTNICVAVAIKMLKNTATGSERTDFIHEIETMKRVAQGNNPHVITFIGCATLQEPLCLITEFVKYGDLLSYLETIRKLVTHKNRQKRMAKLMADLSKDREPEPYLEPHSQDQYEEFPLSGAAAVQCKPEFGKDISGDKVVPNPGTLYAELGGVEPVNLLSFAYQIAYGMEYLASIDVVHRDLACRNILIGEHKTLKISDFGMSRIVTGEDIYVKTTKGRLPWKWMAIESIINREFTHASDVWAYGVTIWEIATLGGFPYPTISNADLLDHLKKGYRLECPENCSPEVYQVMAECWNEYPDERRSFTELRSIFDAMLAEDSPYIQFENINVHKPYYNIGSRRNTKCEEEDIMANLSGSDIEFESSTSTMTLNGASVNGGVYDNLIPLLTRDTPPSDLEEQPSYNLHIANQYVDTPTTFKCLEQDEENSHTTEIIIHPQ